MEAVGPLVDNAKQAELEPMHTQPAARKLCVRHQRMADEAAACLSGNVLHWFESLDDETQESWKLLRRALLARWGQANQPGTPVAAAAGGPYVLT